MTRVPLCNGRPVTAPALFGLRLPLCWRCSTMVTTACVATALPPAGLDPLSASVIVLAAFVANAVDGYRSHFTSRSTTNCRRAVCGGALGVAIAIVDGQLRSF